MKMQLRSDARVISIAPLQGSDERQILLAIEDPETPGVYGPLDWAHECGPSFAFDEAGDLRFHDGSRCYGAPIPFEDSTAEALAASPDWTHQYGVFVEGYRHGG